MYEGNPLLKSKCFRYEWNGDFSHVSKKLSHVRMLNVPVEMAAAVLGIKTKMKGTVCKCTFVLVTKSTCFIQPCLDGPSHDSLVNLITGNAVPKNRLALTFLPDDGPEKCTRPPLHSTVFLLKCFHYSRGKV